MKHQVFGDTTLEIANYKSAYEIIGPIMVGPSSSHTAGAVRIGNVARQLLGEEPEEVVFSLMESFAKTYQGHGTDLALIAGVLGFTTKDSDVSLAKERAEEAGLRYNFLEADLGNYHPNTVRINLWGPTKHVEIIGSSIGGGKIEIKEFNGYDVKFSGERPTLVLLHPDRVGFINAITEYLSRHAINISALTNRRSKINGPSVSIYELDMNLIDDDIESLKQQFPFIEDGAMVYVQ
ncbi:L-serine ammonia-lyase, iron-sulfur-dependent subunit beta [Falseniella ignava]|uniref:L-serine ammonia-lyase, iron-sulfur-dependent subunit beta n=1 Tax=Falseniella ignava TaxID=137730 RepID=UPI0024681244|nr:L-serine ammonia-lyase, iron-sulfur-dependent subunit beta [Falseniella ignava]